MPTDFRVLGWAVERDRLTGGCKHSDIKDVAYPYIY